MTGRIARARSLLARPGAWLGPEPEGGYGVRQGPDRRARVQLRLDETGFRALVEQPGLHPRAGGGWTLRRALADVPAPPPGRPGVIPGERPVMDQDGRMTLKPANLGESPIAWLARRKDAAGRPWLAPTEMMAGERLRLDAERALKGPSLTMRWDALPRAGAGPAARSEPTDGALAAARRVEAALTACGPRLRPIAEAVCVRGSSLQLAEQALSLRRRQGKTLLRQALQALAEHYGLA